MDAIPIVGEFQARLRHICENHGIENLELSKVPRGRSNAEFQLVPFPSKAPNMDFSLIVKWEFSFPSSISLLWLALDSFPSLSSSLLLIPKSSHHTLFVCV